MAYCTSTDITAQLGTRADQLVALTPAHVTAFIADADAWIKGALGSVFVPFNATGDTPETPQRVREIATTYALGLCRRQLAERSGITPDMDLANEDIGRAESMLAALLSSPEILLSPEQVASETITYGLGVNTWDLPTNQATVGFASASPITHTIGGVKVSPNIFPRSVRVLATSTASDGTAGSQLALMRAGSEWDFHYDNSRLAWIFCANHTALYGTGASIDLAYEWDYRRIARPLGRVPSYVVESRW